MVGGNAGTADTSGYWNTFLGYDSGAANIGGFQNVYIGNRAGDLGTSTSNNVCIGVDSCISEDGTHDTALGKGSMSGTGNDDDVAIGYTSSMSNNVTNSVAVGSGATVTGSNGVAIGYGVTAAANKVHLGNVTQFVAIATTTTPTARLHIRGGNFNAGQAPLKIDSGPKLTTPEAGSIETDGTHLYWTNDSGSRIQLDN